MAMDEAEKTSLKAMIPSDDQFANLAFKIEVGNLERNTALLVENLRRLRPALEDLNYETPERLMEMPLDVMAKTLMEHPWPREYADVVGATVACISANRWSHEEMRRIAQEAGSSGSRH